MCYYVIMTYSAEYLTDLPAQYQIPDNAPLVAIDLEHGRGLPPGSDIYISIILI